MVLSRNGAGFPLILSEMAWDISTFAKAGLGIKA
jgi:hypothetical protein